MASIREHRSITLNGFLALLLFFGLAGYAGYVVYQVSLTVAQQVNPQAAMFTPLWQVGVMIEHPHLMQAGQSDYHFLRARADAIGFDVLVIGKTLYFHPVGYKAPPSLRLSAETDLLDFHAAVTSMNQPTKVQVGGWDVANKKSIVGTADSGSLGQGSGPSRSKAAFGAAQITDGEFPVASQAEAEARARAQLLRDALGHVTAEATLHGNSAIKAGVVVTIADVGSRFSGNYYVTSAGHDFTLGGSGRYETRLTMRRIAS